MLATSEFPLREHVIITFRAQTGHVAQTVYNVILIDQQTIITVNSMDVWPAGSAFSVLSILLFI